MGHDYRRMYHSGTFVLQRREERNRTWSIGVRYMFNKTIMPNTKTKLIAFAVLLSSCVVTVATTECNNSDNENLEDNNGNTYYCDSGSCFSKWDTTTAGCIQQERSCCNAAKKETVTGQ